MYWLPEFNDWADADGHRVRLPKACAARAITLIDHDSTPAGVRGHWPGAPQVELAAYFVVSEALTNVAKYARGRAATVRVTRADGTLRVEIADDGVGGADASGSGLRGLAARVEALAGRLQLSSRPGAGTVVIAEIPCGS